MSGRPRVLNFIQTTSKKAAAVQYKKNWIRYVEAPAELLQGYTWVFTDGSTTGWHAAVLILPGLNIRRLAAHVAPTPTRNVGAEMNGLILGLKHAQSGIPVWAVFDYVGVGAWITGGWEIKSFEVQEQVRKIEKIIDERDLTLNLFHHPGHQKDKSQFTFFNGVADSLCSGKKAVDSVEQLTSKGKTNG
jgi:hypothetical protein